jgi:leucyl/phenylalanyl-tRNA--protein transferase
MSRLPWLAENAPPESLPPAELASDEPNGLLAVGGSLDPAWLLHAYEHGVFPWYNPGEPILWWSPDPRAVLRPGDLRLSRSLRRTIRSGKFDIRADTSFVAVIEGCAAPRAGAAGTWITPQMNSAFRRLHALGYAHSFEAWENDRLAGGLYGIAIGRVFFGESMFSRTNNASKVAFAHAVHYLACSDFALIDCQVPSAHLDRLGATLLRRSEFLRTLQTLCATARAPGSWQRDFAAWFRSQCGNCATP